MRRHLPLLALVGFAILFGVIILLANQGRGFWGFLEEIPFGDKLGHIGLVGTLALLLNLTLRNRRLPAPLGMIQMGSGLVAVVMTIEEFSQLFLPTRSPDLLDWLANLTGAALAQFAATRLATLRAKRRKSLESAE
jgi:VanZ family protein